MIPVQYIDMMSDAVASAIIKNALDDYWWAFAKATERQEEKFIDILRPLFAAQEKEVLANIHRNPPPKKDRTDPRIFGIPVAMAQEEDGSILVTDSMVNMYGVGATVEEARRDYRNTIYAYYADLKENEGNLGDGLKLNLAYLRKAMAPSDQVEDWLFDPVAWGEEFTEATRPLELATVTASGQTALAEVGLTMTFDQASPAVRDFLATKDLIFKKVQDTTTEQLRGELLEALDAGEGIPLVTKRVEKVFGFTEKFRNERIARTEIIGAANFGTFEGYEQSGVVKEKKWVTSRDSRVRDLHVDMEGDHVPLKETFSNGLMYPGDQSGPPEEFINCRCTIIVESFEE